MDKTLQIVGAKRDRGCIYQAMSSFGDSQLFQDWDVEYRPEYDLDSKSFLVPVVSKRCLSDQRMRKIMCTRSSNTVLPFLVDPSVGSDLERMLGIEASALAKRFPTSTEEELDANFVLAVNQIVSSHLKRKIVGELNVVLEGATCSADGIFNPPHDDLHEKRMFFLKYFA